MGRTRWIEINRFSLELPIGAPLRIAHLSDLHLTGLGGRERRVAAILERESPDLIAITGDVLSEGASFDQVKIALTAFHAPLGVWLVLGNWDYASPLPSSGGELKRLGIHLLRNKASQVRPGIWVAGFEDAVAGFPNMEGALGGIPNDELTIALFHSPAYFDELASRVSIGFAGHTHGGQVRLPFLNPLWLPRGSGEYVSGWYQKGASRMYVSRGIGMAILPFRLLCRPEVALVTLKPLMTQ